MSRSQDYPNEYYWARDRRNTIDHLAFFNAFQYESTSTLIRKYENILNNYVPDENQRRQLQISFEEWRDSEEAANYWRVHDERLNELYAATLPTAGSTIRTPTFDRSTYYLNTLDAIDLLRDNIARTPDTTFNVNNINVNDQFRLFQQGVLAQLQRLRLDFATHLEHTLATQSILLLRNATHDDLLRHFNDQTRTNLRNTLLQRVGMSTNEFGDDLLDEIRAIFRDFERQRITTTRAAQRLNNLIGAEQGLNLYQTKIINCFKGMLESLPREELDVGETELVTRYIITYLRPLFDDVSNREYLRFISMETEESSEKDDDDDHVGRLEGYLTKSIENRHVNVGFCLVLTTQDANNLEKVNLDLYQMGVLSKNTIDANNLGGALSIQVIGTEITFYLMEKQTNSLYTMTELDRIEFPALKNDIPNLFGLVDNLCDILDVFQTRCQQQ